MREDESRLNRAEAWNNGEEPISTTGKFGADIDVDLNNFALKSNVSSRSLENTRNFNSTAK
jgi:hypothetical protein